MKVSKYVNFHKTTEKLVPIFVMTSQNFHISAVTFETFRTHDDDVRTSKDCLCSVVAQRTEWSIPIQEYQGSNRAINNFYKTIIYRMLIVEKKKIYKKGPGAILEEAQG